MDDFTNSGWLLELFLKKIVKLLVPCSKMSSHGIVNTFTWVFLKSRVIFKEYVEKYLLRVCCFLMRGGIEGPCCALVKAIKV